MKKMLPLLLLVLSFSFAHPADAQKGYSFPDSVKYKKNIIRWNLTPFVLWSKKNINLGYERVVSPYQSFSVNAGYFELPQFSKNLLDSLEIKNSTDRKGWTIAADYRFYFKKRNKHMAPDGLYWGLYASYHHSQFNNKIILLNQDPSVNALFGAKVNILAAGVELGYQFIIKEKFSIDLIFMGPSVSMYNFNMSLGAEGNIEVDPDDEYLQAIYDILKSAVPGFENLIQEGEVTTSGSNVTMGFGLRYMIQIGYRF
jgi:hypothetical protein